MHSEPLSLDISADDVTEIIIVIVIIISDIFQSVWVLLNTYFRKQIQFFVYLNSRRWTI